MERKNRIIIKGLKQMSSKIIKKITEVFYKKEDDEAAKAKLTYPYYWEDETQETVNTQPRLKLTGLTEGPLPQTEETDAGITKVTELHLGREQLKQKWVLRVVAGIDLGRQYLAAPSEIGIGRKPENHICLRDPKVSRFHALLKVEDNLIYIVDLNSTNGTIVNGEKIMTRRKLSSGDQIRVGETLMQISAEPW
jgi:hypothetical protein